MPERILIHDRKGVEGLLTFVDEMR